MCPRMKHHIPASCAKAHAIGPICGYINGNLKNPKFCFQENADLEGFRKDIAEGWYRLLHSASIHPLAIHPARRRIIDPLSSQLNCFNGVLEKFIIFHLALPFDQIGVHVIAGRKIILVFDACIFLVPNRARPQSPIMYGFSRYLLFWQPTMTLSAQRMPPAAIRG